MESGVSLKFDFFIVGGDKRLTFMANLLAYKNFKVLVYDSNEESLNKSIKQTNSIKYALKNSKNVIAPIPFTKDLKYLYSKNKKIKIKEITSYITGKNRLFGGLIPKKILDFCKNQNIFFYDYYKNKKFVVFNSILTAEAAVGEAILQNPYNMHYSDCLVLGFGNCGRLISNKLKNLCSNVFVCTNDVMEKSWAKAYGYSVFNLDSLIFKVEKFNYIFNTIPKKIFNDDILNHLNSNVSILDITSVGMDLKKHKTKNINYKYSPEIPGRFKYVSSSRILTDVTLKVITKLKK